MQTDLHRLRDWDVIYTAQCMRTSPVVLALNTDGYGCFCIHYCRLNAIKIRDPYRLPWMTHYIDSLSEANYFKKLNANSGYLNVPTYEKERDRTKITCQSSKYLLNRLRFRLMNAPDNFYSRHPSNWLPRENMSGQHWRCHHLQPGLLVPQEQYRINNSYTSAGMSIFEAG